MALNSFQEHHLLLTTLQTIPNDLPAGNVLPISTCMTTPNLLLSTMIVSFIFMDSLPFESYCFDPDFL